MSRVSVALLLVLFAAADAAVAAGFMLAVVEPSMSNLGGRAQILVRTPDGDYQGYGTIATPGVVAVLARLHAEHGSLPWSGLLQEPARIAREGYALLPGAEDLYKGEIARQIAADKAWAAEQAAKIRIPPAGSVATLAILTTDASSVLRKR